MSLREQAISQQLGILEKLGKGEHSLEEVFGEAGIAFCPICKRGTVLPEEIEFINKVGMCPSCDHIINEGKFSD